MHLVEQHVIKRTDPRFALIDVAAFASKNLYNAALYEIRQAFVHDGRYLSYAELDQRMQGHDVYKALPAKVSQHVLRLLDKNWQSYFAACAAYRAEPTKFKSHPRLPTYKHKTAGRCILIYTLQALSTPALKQGLVQPSKLPITVQTHQRPEAITQVRIVPRVSFYVVEVIYERQDPAPSGDPQLYAALDPGVDNLAAITSNKTGFVPRLVNGRPLKSINQFYNKQRAKLQEALGHPGSTNRMNRLTNRRTRRINQYLHAASKAIIALLVAEDIGTLIIGKNVGWKQEAELSRVNNQHFVQIPHARFIEMLEYKAKLAGIRVVFQEESYTSKASFLDGDPLPTYDLGCRQPLAFTGKRVKRGLYRASDGRYLNADVNGSYNILRKAVPTAFANGIEVVVVRPVWLTLARSVPPRARVAA